MATRRKFSHEERLQIYNKFGGRCAYCGCDLDYEEMTIDHILPIYRGGTNYPANLNPCCKSCNRYKSSNTIEEFRKKVGYILNRLNNNSTYKIAKRYKLIDEDEHEIKFYYEELREKELAK